MRLLSELIWREARLLSRTIQDGLLALWRESDGRPVLSLRRLQADVLQPGPGVGDGVFDRPRPQARGICALDVRVMQRVAVGAGRHPDRQLRPRLDPGLEDL